MFADALYLKKITSHANKNGKEYFKIVLSEIKSCVPPSPWDDEVHLFPCEREYNLVVFNNSGYVIARFFHDVNVVNDNGEAGVDMPINISGNFYDKELIYVLDKKLHLFNALLSGSIREGYWLCGQIVKRKVKPFIINRITARYYTLPILWDDINLTDEQKEVKIIREFSWKGRVVVKEVEDSWADDYENSNRDSYWRKMTNKDAFDDPSDYWNID